MYDKVGETSDNCAFLEWGDGFDKATLHRVRPDEVMDPEHKAACLSDEEWQRVVKLVDVAPSLKAEVEKDIHWIENLLWDIHIGRPLHPDAIREGLSLRLLSLNDALNRAEGHAAVEGEQ